MSGATSGAMPLPTGSAAAGPSPSLTPDLGPDLDLNKLYAARLRAVRARPYLATALFALRVVPSRRVPTMAVDRYWRCYASPGFVARTSVDELAGVWVHEVAHLIRDHHGRGDRIARREGFDGAADRLRLNIAADCEINDDIYGDGLDAPRGVITPALLRVPPDELMEDYVRRIRLESLPGGAHLWLDCGSGADGRERAWDLGPDGADGLSEQEQDAVRFRVAQALSGPPGSAPRGWRRWAEEAFHAPQPWRELLGSAVRAAVGGGGAGTDHNYGRPSRRSAALPGVVLPSLRRRPPRVAVVIDTSASVSDAELGSALLEVAAITRTVGGRDRVSVVSCDVAARVARPLCEAEGIPLIGGGGTDLRSGFRTALGRSPRPDVVVCLTDGQTPWPAVAPPCRTVVGLFPRPFYGLRPGDDGYVPDTPPDWARTVRIG
ncbi:VWA-like domain-containing protein [Streptomyces sp. NPDC004787]|uniref:vWA domain-containing protein n=1 Tax=Streptomyces sp. NPDC004787 TaxID=3154291 RepID=UPI0033BB0C39